MQNFFETLNQALESENLVELFPVGENIKYNQTMRFCVDGVFVSVYRDENGRYERPIHYASKCENFVSFINH